MNYERERLALGGELRRLRKQSALTGPQLAVLTGISQSKISKIETGLLLPTPDDIVRIIDAVNAPKDRSKWLNEQLALLKTEFNSWRLAHRYGIAAKQFNVGELELNAALIRVFQTCVIPGLLQTAAYARSVIALANVTGQPDLEDAVCARIERQKLLYDPARSFEFVISESAIWSGFCPREIVARQIEHLCNMLNLPNVQIGIVPIRTWLPTIPQNSFCLFDNQFATVETLTAEIQVSDARDVQQYGSLFQSMAHASLCGDSARAFLSDYGGITWMERNRNGTESY